MTSEQRRCDGEGGSIGGEKCRDTKIKTRNTQRPSWTRAAPTHQYRQKYETWYYWNMDQVVRGKRVSYLSCVSVDRTGGAVNDTALPLTSKYVRLVSAARPAGRVPFI